MPIYQWTGKNRKGKIQKGEMEVSNEEAVKNRLNAQKITPIKINVKPKDLFENIAFLQPKVKEGDIILFARQFSTMIDAGLPIIQCIDILYAQQENKTFKLMLKRIKETVESGSTLAEALKKYPKHFDDLFVNMIRVGETSGNLEEVLNILAVQLEKEHELLSKVKGALTYPAVILFAMIGIAILMLTYILPKLTGVFTDMKVELPASTMFIIAISDVLKNHGILVAVFFIGVIVLLRFFLMTDIGKKTLGFLLVNAPLIKNMVIKVNCSRFARIYSSLLKSGVSSVESLKILSETLTNYYYQNAMKDSAAKIQKGITLSSIISKYPKIFPVLVSQMIQVGEETGKTETILLKLAEFYEDEVSQLSKNMSSIIEPILMIFIGVAVGFMAFAILMPIYNIAGQIQ